jgi:hypothetical protein
MRETMVLRRPIETEAIRRCSAGESGVILAPNYRAVPVISVYRWMARQKLGLVVQIDQAEALAPARTFGQSLVLIGGLALLATAGLHHHLIRNGTRGRTGLVLESAEPREVHHFALLIGYGCSAINPYLAYETIDDLIKEGLLQNTDHKTAVKKFVKAAIKGVVKTMAKMGISTVQSYRGAQIFEAVGLNSEVVDKYFTWTPSRIQGVGLDVIAEEALARAGASIDVRYRVEAQPQQSVHVGMLCEAPYGTHPPADAVAAPIDWGLCGARTGALLDMTARFASAPIGAWQTLSIPLACLTSNGADLAHVSAPFAVASNGKFAVSFSEVRISRDAGKTTCH